MAHPDGQAPAQDDYDDAEREAAAEQHTRSRSRHARLSMSAQAHQVWIRKKTRRWYSVLAGALAGGLAILCEKKGRRTGIAQQMFVRCVYVCVFACFGRSIDSEFGHGVVDCRDRIMLSRIDMGYIYPTAR